MGEKTMGRRMCGGLVVAAFALLSLSPFAQGEKASSSGTLAKAPRSRNSTDFRIPGVAFAELSANLRAKRALISGLSEGAAAPPHYELCERPLSPFTWSGDRRLFVFAALLAPQLPFFEVLFSVFPRNHMQCFTAPPKIAPLATAVTSGMTSP
eukprot:RCo029027